MTVAVNCDMGESFGLWSVGDDEALMPLISMANVACGFHAGDPVVMRDTVALAKAHDVRVGAHPGYPDLQGFGRRAIAMDPEELTAAILYQAGALKAFLDAQDMELSHLKPHGALYGRAARDADVAHAVADAAELLGVPVMGMANTVHEEVYEGRGVGFLAEFYADLDYDDDGGLIITRQHAAYDPERVRESVARVLTEGVALSRSGKEIPMRADCVCVHSDTPGAPELARAVNDAVRHAAAPSRPQ
jgi:5-oxoprolinase (ATP-hydrolysing) subunit A